MQLSLSMLTIRWQPPVPSMSTTVGELPMSRSATSTRRRWCHHCRAPVIGSSETSDSASSPTCGFWTQSPTVMKSWVRSLLMAVAVDDRIEGPELLSREGVDRVELAVRAVEAGRWHVEHVPRTVREGHVRREERRAVQRVPVAAEIHGRLRRAERHGPGPVAEVRLAGARRVFHAAG